MGVFLMEHWHASTFVGKSSREIRSHFFLCGISEIVIGLGARILNRSGFLKKIETRASQRESQAFYAPWLPQTYSLYPSQD
jgi:hypothetical protein